MPVHRGYKGVVRIMHIVFFSTNNVFKAEELLTNANIECQVVPTPVQDKAYCGVCIMTTEKRAVELLRDIEFKLVEET